MNITAKIEYGCLAVLDMAIHQSLGKPLRARDIAARHGIPSHFLVQILLPLKAAGLVRSTRGAAGGYQLARPAESITLGEVMRAIEGGLERPTPTSPDPSPQAKVLFEEWGELHDARQQRLDRLTLAELASRASTEGAVMYYI